MLRKFISLDKLKERKSSNLYGTFVCLSYDNRKPLLSRQASLKKNWPEIYDQGQIGSCTANAFCSAFKFLEKHRDFDPSRLYVYYKERLLENPGGEITDSGAWVEDAYAWVAKNGVCSENSWPYNEYNVNISPTQECDSEAIQHRANGYFKIKLDRNLKSTIKNCITQNHPVLMAFGVYQSFMDSANGMVDVPHPYGYYEDPNDSEDPFLGGHEVVIIGYDDNKKQFELANSWGISWGDKGFFYIPYSFVDNTKLVYDFSVLLSAA